ncbi:MAG: molecular chaperone, partial [Ruminiclostridium sp.]|nr:molecular chaperone [Ruminiclostridium sp.]
MNLRHEWKHRLSPGDLPILRARLRAVMTPDPHAVGGSYHIRSLYFDTPADTALREKLDGV